MILQSNQSVQSRAGTINQVNTQAARLRGERRYYLIAAVGIIAIVLAGFSIDFDLLFNMSSLSFLVRAHGLVMFAWVGLFFAQVFLVARHRVDLHRRPGIFGVALALLIVIIGTYTSIVAARLGGNHLPPGMPAIPFLSASLLLLFAFIVLAGTGLAMRRRPDVTGDVAAARRCACPFHLCIHSLVDRRVDGAQSDGFGLHHRGYRTISSPPSGIRRGRSTPYRVRLRASVVAWDHGVAAFC